jgi:CelD/BcsL family acetyltransferase involved in cellulose biosynthesis
MLGQSEVLEHVAAPLAVRLSPATALDAPLMRAWTSLTHVASEPNAFAEPWFMASAIAHLRGSRDIQIAQIWLGETRLVGIIMLTEQARYGRMPARHIGNWVHYQSFMGTPLIEQGFEVAAWRALITALDTSDWAVGFLSLTGLNEGDVVHQGLVRAADELGRESPTVHRFERALLTSGQDAQTYLAHQIRGKKRKELRRLASRLGEIGTVSFRQLSDAATIPEWCDAFLTLESAGWKGKDGAALANTPATAQFFRDVVKGAFANNRLDFQRLDLDGRPMAMLVNFRTPPGSWSFKIAYDEGLSRFSPGVMIELENLRLVLEDAEVDWMDSCAVADHPMINSLWGERRSIIQVSVPLSGAKRTAIYRACRAAETASARLRQYRKPNQ